MQLAHAVTLLQDTPIGLEFELEMVLEMDTVQGGMQCFTIILAENRLTPREGVLFHTLDEKCWLIDRHTKEKSGHIFRGKCPVKGTLMLAWDHNEAIKIVNHKWDLTFERSENDEHN